jgi:hypothetical protein
MLGVDGVVLDRRVEPEAVAVPLAVVEGRLELFAPAASATPATAAPAPRARLAVPLGFALLFASGLLLRLVVVALGLLRLVLFLLLGGLFGRRRLDLGLDLVAEIDLDTAGVLAVGRNSEAETSS